MMNVFMFFKFSSKMNLHHMTMLTNLFSFNSNADVSSFF